MERFTRANAQTIHYEVTIDDPTVYTRPWKVAIPLEREDGYTIYEYACHEGNYSLANILAGARHEERAAAAVATPASASNP